MSRSSFSSTEFFQDFLGKVHSRKLLVQNPQNQTTASPPPHSIESSLDKDVLMILSVLICTVIFSVVLNSLIRYALSCLKLSVSSDSSASTAASKSINNGIKKKALKTFPVVKYSTELKLPGMDTECVICLSEFVPGDRVRILPKCNHGFHLGCIDKWLRSNSSCPKCRRGLIETCQKIVGSCPPRPSVSVPVPVPVPETVVSIRPLEPEGVVHNY